MGKGKPRHNPYKPQNCFGSYCSYYEEYGDKHWCEHAYDTSKCKGNPHNCVKVKYQILASRSDVQKNNGDGISSRKY